VAYKELQGKNAARKQLVGKLKSQLKGADAKISTLSAKLSKETTEETEATKTEDEQKTEIATLQAKVKKLATQTMAAHKATSEAHQAAKDTAGQLHGATASQQSVLKKKLESQKKELSAKQSQLHALTKQLSKEASQLKAAIAKAKTGSGATKKSMALMQVDEVVPEDTGAVMGVVNKELPAPSMELLTAEASKAVAAATAAQKKVAALEKEVAASKAAIAKSRTAVKSLEHDEHATEKELSPGAPQPSTLQAAEKKVQQLRHAVKTSSVQVKVDSAKLKQLQQAEAHPGKLPATPKIAAAQARAAVLEKEVQALEKAVDTNKEELRRVEHHGFSAGDLVCVNHPTLSCILDMSLGFLLFLLAVIGMFVQLCIVRQDPGPKASTANQPWLAWARQEAEYLTNLLAGVAVIAMSIYLIVVDSDLVLKYYRETHLLAVDLFIMIPWLGHLSGTVLYFLYKRMPLFVTEWQLVSLLYAVPRLVSTSITMSKQLSKQRSDTHEGLSALSVRMTVLVIMILLGIRALVGLSIVQRLRQRLFGASAPKDSKTLKDSTLGKSTGDPKKDTKKDVVKPKAEGAKTETDAKAAVRPQQRVKSRPYQGGRGQAGW
jgi:hypothetical protein